VSFKDEVWNTREATLGDIAETAFEHNYGPNSGWQWERYGLNRPRVSMFNIDPFVRYTPDYLLEGPDGTVRLVEVQGCGRDGLFKFKDDKIDALLDWHYQTNESTDNQVSFLRGSRTSPFTSNIWISHESLGMGAERNRIST